MAFFRQLMGGGRGGGIPRCVSLPAFLHRSQLQSKQMLRDIRSPFGWTHVAALHAAASLPPSLPRSSWPTTERQHTPPPHPPASSSPPAALLRATPRPLHRQGSSRAAAADTFIILSFFLSFIIYLGDLYPSFPTSGVLGTWGGRTSPEKGNILWSGLQPVVVSPIS